MGQSAQKPIYTPFGSLFEPIGFIGGKPVWPVIGGAEGDGTQSGSEGTQGGEGNAGQSAGEEQNSGGEGSGNGSEGDGQSANESEEDKPVTRAEFDKLRNQLSAADKKRAEAEAKVQKFEDANRSELEKAQKAAEEAAKERDSAREQLREVGIREAFRDVSETQKPPLTWHNNIVAMGLLDKDLYEMAEDGTVSGMDKAVKALAKDHSYLLNTGKGGGEGGASGAPLNGGKTNAPTTDKDKLAVKYRALRGRGGTI